MAISETVDININSTQALASLRSIERNVDLLTNGFRDFMTGVAEGMTSALNETNKASAGLSKMKQNVDGLNASVGKTNIGRKMGAEVAQATRSMGAFQSQVAQTGKQLLGLESIVGAFAFTQLIRGANEYARSNVGFSEANLNSVRAQEMMGQNLKNLYQAILNVIEPLNKIAASTQITVSAFEALIKGLLAAGGAFLFFTRILGPLLTAIRTFGGALTAFFISPLSTLSALIMGPLRVAFGFLKTAVSYIIFPFVALFQIIQKLTAAGGSLITAFRNLSMIFRVALSIAAGSVIALIGAFAAKLIGFALIVYSVVQAIEFLAQTFFKFSVLDWVGGKLDAVIKKFKEFFGLQSQQTGAMGRTYSSEEVKRLEEEFNKRTELRLEAQKQADENIKNYQRQNRNALEQLRLQNSIFNATSDQAEIEKTMLDMRQRQRDVVEKIQDKIRQGVTPEVKQILEGEIAAYQKMQSAADAAQIAEIKRLQAQRNERERLNRQIEYTIELFNQQAERSSAVTEARGAIVGRRGDIAFERSLIGMGGFERELRSRRREIDQFRNDLIRSTTEAFTIGGEIVDPEAFNAAIQEIYKGTAQLKADLDSLTAASRRFDAGWQEAFENYVDNALNAAEQARSYFEIFSRGFENIFMSMTRGFPGIRDAFRGLINDMIAQFLKLQAQRAFLALFGDDKNSGMLMNFFRFAVSGRANGGPVSANTPYIIGEMGPELFVPRSAGTVVPNHQLGGGTTVVNYNIQAVDASSFRQLVARDPAFIYAVTERGRAAQPTRRAG